MPAARGIAGFFGVFSLLNLIGTAMGSRVAGDAWWIDLSHLPAALAGPFALVAALALLAWAIFPDAGALVRTAAAASAALLSLVCVANALAVWMAARNGAIALTFPVPLSLVVAGCMAWVALVAARSEAWSGGRSGAAAVAVAVALVVAFPVANALFFGTTDYRRPADAAVVFGARAYPDGTLSSSLSDRVSTAVELYRRGYVRTLVMTGGVGESGIDETVAMRDRAVALGVPAGAILRDPTGVSTDASVSGTLPLLDAHGCRDVLVVSQFYHLPRIKMAYRIAGRDVRTVPAEGGYWIGQTPALVIREIGGFWGYWARGLLRRGPVA